MEPMEETALETIMGSIRVYIYKLDKFAQDKATIARSKCFPAYIMTYFDSFLASESADLTCSVLRSTSSSLSQKLGTTWRESLD